MKKRKAIISTMPRTVFDFKIDEIEHKIDSRKQSKMKTERVEDVSDLNEKDENQPVL